MPDFQFRFSPRPDHPAGAFFMRRFAGGVNKICDCRDFPLDVFCDYREYLSNTTGETDMELKSAIAAMQTKRQPRKAVWQNANGTFSHHRDAQREWADESACHIDLRFHEEWAA